MDGQRSTIWKVLVPVIAIIIVAIIVAAAIYHPPSPEPNTLYQVSPFDVFSDGRFDGNTTYAELAKHGDFGIGTLNGLDGEMIALDGKFYQIPTEGGPREIGSTEKTPYATVTFFHEDQGFQVTNVQNYSQLRSEIDRQLPSHDAIYAIKVVGYFDLAETRSVPKQTQPYPTLTIALQNQTIFNLTGVQGTAVGFFFPDSMDGVDYVGYHLHFLTDDRTAGGHLLDCEIRNATVMLDQIENYRLLLA